MPQVRDAVSVDRSAGCCRTLDHCCTVHHNHTANRPHLHHPGHTAARTPAAWPQCPAWTAQHPCQTRPCLQSTQHRRSSAQPDQTNSTSVSAAKVQHQAGNCMHVQLLLHKTAVNSPNPGSCLTTVALISASWSRTSCCTKGSSTSTQSPYSAVGPAAAAAMPCKQTGKVV